MDEKDIKVTVSGREILKLENGILTIDINYRIKDTVLNEIQKIFIKTALDYLQIGSIDR